MQVGLGLGLGLPPVKCHSASLKWNFAGRTVSGGWIRGNADGWGLLSPSSAGRSDQTDPSAAIGVLWRYTVHGMIPRGQVQMMPPTLTRALGRHPGPNYATFRSACRPQCRERQENTTVKSPIGQNVTQDLLLILVMSIVHAARALA